MTTPQKDLDNNFKQQAAGFPPFTRGYHEYAFTTKTILNSETLNFDYILKSNSIEDIYELFLFYLHDNNSKPKFHLLLKTPTNTELVSLTNTLRTILSLINHHKYNDAATTKFHFYIKHQDSKSILSAYQYSLASQIDTLIISTKQRFLLQNSLTTTMPLDPFFGSIQIRKQTEELITEIWNKIIHLV